MTPNTPPAPVVGYAQPARGPIGWTRHGAVCTLVIPPPSIWRLLVPRAAAFCAAVLVVGLASLSLASAIDSSESRKTLQIMLGFVLGCIVLRSGLGFLTAVRLARAETLIRVDDAEGMTIIGPGCSGGDVELSWPRGGVRG